ncbi:ethanolamine ammonia-lyase subunit EutB [Deinococcus sp. Arct2-2]|uniref:ethanolamine ammonia-lyase subunit EutB n=1 Tax=Deinococcus sp. Arct2-2 TaxID=2568653 RepID=UPI0010A4E0B8|nr:ethanolamine ammonia-lyase subunit EutB [Deinococcus sp. Arct2-2]THF71550.1 ethanolamine ammonia-lyase subunit EutB [Deinococcus sp. Arct2-2]
MSNATLYSATLGRTHHRFADLKDVLAKASPRKAGDELAGLAARSAEEREAARLCLSELPLTLFLEDLLIPYEDDEVTRLIVDSHDAAAFAPVAGLNVGQFRDWLLSEAATTQTLRALAPGLTPEMVAAVCKLMRNQDLVLVARKCEVITRFRNTLGRRGHFSTRLQPNHPTDDLRGILASTLDGLMFGAGDAVIGVNPALDNVDACVRLLTLLDDLRQGLGAPVQSCVLTHVTNTVQAIERGAPVDLVFQSVAGTQGANAGFGINLALLTEAHAAAQSLGRGSLFADGQGGMQRGQNVMYFETGQGSALSSGTHAGLDQQTAEARAYAVARAYSPLLVNTVVGFIGPEYLYDGKQIVRAGLEDHCCGKLLGLPMGCDICYTNHAEADSDDMDTLLTLLAAAGVTFIMGVPGADDIMLGYQSTSFHDAWYVRSVFGYPPAPEFAAWLDSAGITRAGQLQLPPIGSPLREQVRQLGAG